MNIGDKLTHTTIDARTKEVVTVEEEITQEVIDKYNAQEVESNRKNILMRLSEIDKRLSRASVIADIIAGNPPYQTTLDLLSERETLVSQLNNN
jgi:hypothetical protein